MSADAHTLAASTASPRYASALGTRVRTFLAWWRSELLAALPQGWRERLAGRVAGVPLLLLADEMVFFAVQGGRLIERARVQISGLEAQARTAAVRQQLAGQDVAADALIILLPAESFVRKVIELPVAAEESLRQVIGFELDRHTPFKAGDAEFDVRTLGRTRDNANIRVEFVAAPKDIVQSARRQAEALGLRVVAMAPCMEEGGWREFDLLPRDASANEGVSPALRLNLAVGAAFLILLAAALAVPILQKRDAAIRLLPKLNEARAESEKVQRTRSELEKLVADANFLLGKKYAQVPATQLVEDLARIFPDTTWVAALEVKAGKQRELVLTGETASATRVVEMLEQVPYLKNATFRSPLSKTPGQVAERFVIAAEFKPRPLPAMVDAVSDPVTASPAQMPAVPLPAINGPNAAPQGAAGANSGGQAAAAGAPAGAASPAKAAAPSPPTAPSTAPSTAPASPAAPGAPQKAKP